MKKNYNILGFIRYNISEKEYNKFILKTKEKYYIKLKETKKIKIFLEIQDQNINKFENTICYIFYNIGKNINFKTTEIIFSTKVTKKEILDIKKEITADIINKIDDINNSISPEDYLDKIKFKYI